MSRIAVALHDALFSPKMWLWFEAFLLATAWLISGSIWGGLLTALFTPIAAMGLFFIYGFIAMARDWFQVILVGAAFGAIVVIGRATETGVSAGESGGLFLLSMLSVAALRLVEDYVAPIWRR